MGGETGGTTYLCSYKPQKLTGSLSYTSLSCCQCHIWETHTTGSGNYRDLRSYTGLGYSVLVQKPLTRDGYTLSQQKMNTPLVDRVKEKIWNGRTGGNKSILKTNILPPPQDTQGCRDLPEQQQQTLVKATILALWADPSPQCRLPPLACVRPLPGGCCSLSEAVDRELRLEDGREPPRSACASCKSCRSLVVSSKFKWLSSWSNSFFAFPM